MFVALQLGGTDACVVTCPDNDTPDRNYWSNAAAAPFSWVQTSSFGVNDDLKMELNGYIDP